MGWHFKSEEVRQPYSLVKSRRVEPKTQTPPTLTDGYTAPKRGHSRYIQFTTPSNIGLVLLVIYWYSTATLLVLHWYYTATSLILH